MHLRFPAPRIHPDEGRIARHFVGHVRGTGLNQPSGIVPGSLMAKANQALGPQIFANRLQGAQLDLFSKCGG